MSNASEYADSLAAGIKADTDSGHPFGVSTEEEPIVDREIGDEGSAMDWLESALDIQYMVSGDRTYRSARVLVAWGGPTAWVDTRTEQLEVSWGSDFEVRDLPSEFVHGLDDALEELWEMGA